MSSPRSLTLKDLVHMASEKHGTTAVVKLASIARKGGFPTNHTTIATIRAGTYPSRPSVETLDALAYLAGVPKEVAYAAGDLEIVGGTRFTKQLPRDVDLLTPAQREAVLGVIRALIEANRALKRSQLPERGSERVNRVIDEGDIVAYIEDDGLDGPDELTPSG